MNKFIDLGEKPTETQTLPVKKAEPYYPSFSVRNTDLDLDDALVDKELEATVKVRLKRIERRTMPEGKKTEIGFDLLAIKFDNLPQESLQRKIEKGLENAEGEK